MEQIEISKKELCDELFNDILFFMFAESGAMGEMGAIYFINKYGNLYHLNYLRGDIELEDILLHFKTLAQCKFGLGGLNSSVPVGWYYVNLGAGNHLSVKDEVYPEFSELVKNKNYKRISRLYRDWKDLANTIINKG